MSKYEDFEIVIEKVSDYKIYAVNVRRACGGQGDASGSFSFAEITAPPADPNQIEDNNPQPPIRHMISSGGQPKNYTLLLTNSLSKEMAKKVGVRLAQALFKQEIRDLWVVCKTYCKGVGATLRIRLDLTRAPELAALPWEYMRLPDDTNFVGLDMDTTLVRYLRTADPIRPLKVIPPLRILVMAAAPQDLPPLAGNDEILQIKEDIAKLSGGFIEIFDLPQTVDGHVLEATVDGLKSTLKAAQEKDEPFHIFHFIGHGGFDEERQEGVLFFEDGQGKSRAVGHNELGELLQPYRSDLRLIVLNACEGARLSVTEIYSSVAAKIMQIAEIPAAIAMQFSISDPAAIAFAKAFYERIAAGDYLERAVDAARLAVSAANNVANNAKEEWATPVFYLRADDGHLFDVKIPAPPKNLTGHYEAIKTLLSTCNLVVFLGLNVNLLNRPSYNPYKLGKWLPSAAELCSYLNKEHKISPPGNSLAGLAKQLQLRGELLPDVFTPLFRTSDESSKLYQVLGDMTQKITRQLPVKPEDPCHGAMLFVTTTYDSALENAFKKAGISEYHTVFYGQNDENIWLFSHRHYKDGQVEIIPLIPPNTPNKYEGLRNNAPVILKLPGEITTGSSFAITEDDFFALAHRGLSELLPVDILGQINTSRHLYLGYDLQNWTLRLLWNRVCENQKAKMKELSYAVVLGDGEDPNALFWGENKIKFATASLDDYVAGLEEYVLRQL